MNAKKPAATADGTAGQFLRDMQAAQANALHECACAWQESLVATAAARDPAALLLAQSDMWSKLMASWLRNQDDIYQSCLALQEGLAPPDLAALFNGPRQALQQAMHPWWSMLHAAEVAPDMTT